MGDRKRETSDTPILENRIKSIIYLRYRHRPCSQWDLGRLRSLFDQVEPPPTDEENTSESEERAKKQLSVEHRVKPPTHLKNILATSQNVEKPTEN